MAFYRYQQLLAVIVCMALSTSGCITQFGNETGDSGVEGVRYMKDQKSILMVAEAFVAENEYFYAAAGSVVCLDWQGTVLWETPDLGSTSITVLEDGIFTKTYSEKDIAGVAFLSLEGDVVWQKDLGFFSPDAIGGSSELLVVGASGTLWAFSRTGEALWEYKHSIGINQVVVVPDNSCVVFTDYNYAINCVSQNELLWSSAPGDVHFGDTGRNVRIAPDSSYVVYGSKKGGSSLVAATLTGQELWSFPVKEYLCSAEITRDSEYIIAGAYNHVYKLRRDGTPVWDKRIPGNNYYLALTYEADYIAVGSIGLPSTFFLLDETGNALWAVKSLDTIWAVTISPDGKHAAFCNRLHRLYILTNPPE
ncbi:MAG: PQQ-binding-like beta-propeller repeat protein [Theionarchaea archaeon]|nr:PQQ-binding-like beta-propeller repeat protein [Theionarchaea archaeon]MBU7022369.1 PQQ-binding-like beta-propeller repeat protein [Theionarchaea archaeon]